MLFATLWLPKLAPLLVVVALAAGCSSPPVLVDDGPSVIIASRDISRVKAAILDQTSIEHFTVEADGDTGDHLFVSRPISMSDFESTPNLPPHVLEQCTNCCEVEEFHIETTNAGIRVYVGRVEQMDLPPVSKGCLFGNYQYAIMNTDQYMALKALLDTLKRQVEGK